jgi:hypothetical protein
MKFNATHPEFHFAEDVFLKSVEQGALQRDVPLTSSMTITSSEQGRASTPMWKIRKITQAL